MVQNRCSTVRAKKESNCLRAKEQLGLLLKPSNDRVDCRVDSPAAVHEVRRFSAFFFSGGRLAEDHSLRSVFTHDHITRFWSAFGRDHFLQTHAHVCFLLRAPLDLESFPNHTRPEVPHKVYQILLIIQHFTQPLLHFLSSSLLLQIQRLPTHPLLRVTTTARSPTRFHQHSIHHVSLSASRWTMRADHHIPTHLFLSNTTISVRKFSFNKRILIIPSRITI
mmetsp:Transcript_4786/g.10225  ORF Transcript_4786/g.10225 Transcript_4786/m.10225 type:complete len:222 (-) Transcript_4786:211-876(-)